MPASESTPTIAMAPCNVCTERASLSSTAASQAVFPARYARMPSRCWPTSVRNTSSRIGSMMGKPDTGDVMTGSTGAATTDSAGCTASFAGTQRRTVRTTFRYPWARSSMRADSPEASLSAVCMIASGGGSIVTLSPCKPACSFGSVATATSTRACTFWSGLMVRSSTRLSMFSTFQLNSPSANAPTSRPEPLSVWNERRTFLSASRSSGLDFHAGRLTLMFAISSPTSSTKTSRISSSMPAASWNDVSTGAPSAAIGSSTSSSTSTQRPWPVPGIADGAALVSDRAVSGASDSAETDDPECRAGAPSVVCAGGADGIGSAAVSASGSAGSRRAGTGQ